MGLCRLGGGQRHLALSADKFDLPINLPYSRDKNPKLFCLGLSGYPAIND